MDGRRIVILAILALWASPIMLATSRRRSSALEYDPEDLLSEDRLSALFERWTRRHGMKYAGHGERESRFRAFRDNVAYVDRRNRESGAQTVGLNRFADMTNEEFREVYSSRIQSPEKRWREGEGRRRELMSNCVTPMSVDWRKKGVVTPVKDQGHCGSCWAFSATGGIEGINAIATGELVSVSEQELVDCDTASDGCDGGYMDYAFEWVIQNGGIDSESDYGYTSYSGNSGVCNVTKAYKVVSIDGYEDVPDDESALLCAVAGQPVSVGLDASSLDFQLYTGGIFYGNCSSDPDDIDHGVLIVGYGSEGGQDYWIVKNSWGTSWGDNGYFYLKRDTGLNHGQCAVNSLASYPTKGVLATPSPYPSPATPPPPSLPPPPPPPPSPPSPEQCGDGTYCNHGETCCCIFELADICFLHGCCGYENAVCCEDSDFCCPQDYPVCDVLDGICLKNPGDFLGVKMKKRRFAKRKFPWTKFDDEEKEASQPPELTWRDEGIAAV